MAEHTPGPWRVSELLADGTIIRVFRTYEVVTPKYDVCAGIPWGGPIRNKADAYLIAATPELLAALEAVVSDDGVYGGMTGNTRLKVRAAIAKAKVGG